MSLDPDTIAQQRDLLAAHRRTLAHLLQQMALIGGVAYASPGVLNSIEEARANIAGIKAYLRENGVSVEDELNDGTLLVPSPAATKTESKADDRHIQGAVLATYFNQMEDLLINKNLLAERPDSGMRSIARTRTLMALRRLDGEHNQILIQFLRDVGLLGEPPASIIDISRANLRGADLRRVDLHGVNLEGANLEGADLEGAVLYDANLSAADLSDADLSRTNLYDANLERAILFHTNLEGADLRGAKIDLSSLYFYDINLEGATMPDGSKPL